MAERAPSHALDRRQLLRGAGVLGGAAAIAAVSATAASSADASPPPYVVLGGNNAASTATSLTITAGSAPTLALTNANGPQLNLTPADDFGGDLAVGDIVNTSQGPLIGVDYGEGAGVETSILVTPADLGYLVPAVQPLSPARRLDTRDKTGGRGFIVRKASGALNTAGQLMAGKWIDLAVGDTMNGYDLGGVFFNIAAVSPLGNGYAAVYPPSVGAHPSSSTVNFSKGVTIANGGIGLVETLTDSFVVRIYASATTHLVFDLTGQITSQSLGSDAAAKPRTRALTRAARTARIRAGTSGTARTTARR